MQRERAQSRPTTKGELQKTRILDEAAHLLIEEGYGGFSLRKVAERLGVRLSHIQYYFKSREALLHDLFARELARARESVARNVQANDIAALIRFILSEQDSAENCRLYWELWAFSSRDAGAHAVMVQFYRDFQDAIAQAIQGTVPSASKATCATRALVIISLLEGASLFRGGGRRTRGTAAVFDEALVRTALEVALGASNEI